MKRRAWQRLCYFVFPLVLCLLVDVTLHAAQGSAASTEAEPEVEQEVIDVVDAAGDSHPREEEPLAAVNEAAPEQEELMHAQEDVLAIPREENVDLDGSVQDDKQPAGSTSAVVRNIISLLLTATIIFLSARIVWDVMNFVGDVPDPFAHVQSPYEIPQAIDDLLNKNVPLAFVIRKCKFCGLGIREMKSHGLEPVVVMIEGHRFQQAIRQHLRSRYHVRGLPYFFINKDEHGYLSAIKAYLRNEH